MDYQQKQGGENKGQDAVKKEDPKVTWKCPTDSNVITSPFGPRNTGIKGASKNHKGIDLRARQGEPYYAAADGTVTQAGGGTYNTIVVDHGGGIVTRYLHASSVSVKANQKVKAGEKLAGSGMKGFEGVKGAAPHLHFEVHVNKQIQNPETFLTGKGISLVHKNGKPAAQNNASGGNATQKSGGSAKGELQMNAEGHPIYYPKGAQDTIERISWNKARNYTKSYIKAFQKLIETNDDGDFGTNTVNAIRHYQEKNKLPSKDGKWGKECADASGLERQYNNGGSTKTPSGGGASAGGGAAPSGLHLNPAPSFDKQYNYKTQPYVSRAHYNAMKEKMGSTPYAQWDVNDKRISGIYAKAKEMNKDKSSPDGNSTIKSSGCGVSAYANLMGISPTESAVMAMEGGYRQYHGGTASDFFRSKGGKDLKSMNAALNEIKDGKYVIYSRGGHFLLLYGYDDKNLYLSDSANSSSPKKSPRTGHQDSNFAHGYSFSK